MILQNQIYSLEFQNFRRTHRNRAGGELFLIEFEITETEWHHLGDFPQDAIGEIALRWTERVAAPEKPRREPKPKQATPFGQFWYELDRSGFHNRLAVRAWLDYDGIDEGEAKRRLREKLGVEHRSTEASPERLIAAMRAAGGLDGAITAAEAAKAKVKID